MNFALDPIRGAAALVLALVVAGAAGCASTAEPPRDGAAFTPGASPGADPWYAGGGVKARKPARDFDFPIFESAQ